MRLPLPLLAAVLLVVGCAAEPASTPNKTPAASFEATIAPTQRTSPSAELRSPAAREVSPPIAVPDPLHALVHSIGEPVALGSSVVTYLGLTERGGAYYSSFSVSGSALDSAKLLVGGSALDLYGTDTLDRLEAGPLPGGRSGLTPQTQLILFAGGVFVAFEAGPLD